MRVYLWIVALTNLAAHGWTFLVLLGTAKTWGEAALMAKDDVYVMFWLDLLAGVLTLGLVIALLMGKAVRKVPPTWMPPQKPGVQWTDLPDPPGLWATQLDRSDR